jgi:RimJ/RimL family protein N-acetyltransferase
MSKPIIKEIKSDQLTSYKEFLRTGLIEDEDNFRLTANDDEEAPFPTNNKEDSFTLGAYINNELAGVVSFERDGAEREKLRHKGILFRMYISKKFRGRGVGRELIGAVMQRAEKLPGIEQINLTVIENNEAAKALYRKCGFVTFGSEKRAIKWKGRYFTEDQMVLFLTDK